MVETYGNPIIVALDKLGKGEAIKIIEELGRNVWGFKLGTLLLSEGVVLLDEIIEKTGSQNLLVDLEFTGTPDFIKDAVSIYARHAGVSHIVVSASSGPEGIRAAVQTAVMSKILVGSVLDSLSPYDIHFLHGTYLREEIALRIAYMAQNEKAYGLYCSAEEVINLSSRPKLKDFPRFVYGVRLEGDSDHGTHEKVLTPKEALGWGADKLVIGRFITQAKNRLEAVKKIRG